MKDPVVLTVDLGFAKKGRNLAAELGVPIAFIEKRRKSKTDAAEALTLIGETADRDVIIIDDEVDTAGSMTEAANLAEENGARDIYSVFVHPVFSEPAVDRLAGSPISHLITTNTVPVAPADIKKLQKGRKVDILDISPLLGEVIRRAHEGRSVGEMFDE
jgi:ribose-phosphate pyrophosphokinase